MPAADNPLLVGMLEVAVLGEQDCMRRVPYADLLAQAGDLAQVLAEKGDVLQFRSKKRGETAAAFVACARALAVLSFTPGGVRVFGKRWEARHPDVEYLEKK